MSNIQQLTSMISALNEKFNQLEHNSKRIFELPENENLNGNSKFAISRPLDLGEITEYTTLNAILEWCIEEMQNIENATRVVQMLPPELLSGPRRIKIPVVDGDDVDVPIVWKILGVDYVEETEVIINIPDASEDNYRKDLILGTQDGDVIRMAGFESEEGVIEPIQPENTVLLTAITLFGSTVLDEPTEPIVGDVYVKKASQGWVGYQINISSTQVAPTLGTNHSIAFRAFANGHSIIGLNITSYVPDKIWSGATIGIRNDSDFPITLKHLYVSSSKIRFNFPSGQDLILTKEMGVKYFKIGTIPTTGPAYAYCLNDFVSGGVTSDDVSNESNVTGATVTDALNNLDTDKLDKAPNGTDNLIDVDNKLNPIYLPPLTADNIDYDNTASGLLAETVQEAVDELSGHITQLHETKEDRVSVIPISANTTISALHHGKILLVTADVTITFPTGLGAGFTGCAFRIATGGKMTPAFASGVTGNDFFADYNPGESLYVFKESDSTNVFYAV